MRALFALVLLAAVADAETPRFKRFTTRTPMGRTQRGLLASSLAAAEIFPASGAGTFGVCSTTPPTGARGEVLTYTGPGDRTCTKGLNGLRSSLIADGDLLTLTAQPRVEFDSDGILGLLVEPAINPITIQARPICNAAYADVGTPACAANITTGPWGTSTMGRLTDNDAVAKEGRSQTIASVSATRFTAFCYVKAGTATAATISLAGTGSALGDCSTTATGLSTATSSIIECTSSVAYAGTLTAVVASILIGSVVADQGTLFVEGCNVVPNATYRSSFVDAAGVAVARAAEWPVRFSPSLMVVRSMAATIQIGAGIPANARVLAATDGSTTTFSSYIEGAGLPLHSLKFVAGPTKDLTGSNVAGSALSRVSAWNIPNTTIAALVNGTETTNGAGVLGEVSANTLYVGTYEGGAGFELSGIISRICVDPASTRCR